MYIKGRNPNFINRKAKKKKLLYHIHKHIYLSNMIYKLFFILFYYYFFETAAYSPSQIGVLVENDDF